MYVRAHLGQESLIDEDFYQGSNSTNKSNYDNIGTDIHLSYCHPHRITTTEDTKTPCLVSLPPEGNPSQLTCATKGGANTEVHGEPTTKEGEWIKLEFKQRMMEMEGRMMGMITMLMETISANSKAMDDKLNKLDQKVSDVIENVTDLKRMIADENHSCEEVSTNKDIKMAQQGIAGVNEDIRVKNSFLDIYTIQ